MSISAYLLQNTIPSQVSKPNHPFDNFGWPAVLYGSLQEYQYPEHLGPFSVNFCFSGVLSVQSKGHEYLADSSSFCITNRNNPTIVRTLTSRRSSQLAFFYAHKFIARLLSPTGVFIEDGKETYPYGLLDHQDSPSIPLLRDGNYPLEGLLRQKITRFRRTLSGANITDETVEEIHTELFESLAEDLNPSLFWYLNTATQEQVDHAEVIKRLELSRLQIELDPVTPQSLDQRAKAVGLSRFHYLRLFKARFKTSPARYCLARKLDIARLLLASRQFSVKEICQLLHYKSWSNFSAAFRESAGITPKEYQLLNFTEKTRHESLHKIRQYPFLNL